MKEIPAYKPHEALLVSADILEEVGLSNISAVLRRLSVDNVEIYVVEGSTGEYSDHTEWLIAAYLNEEDAKKHVLCATEKAEQLGATENTDVFWDRDGQNEWDPNMQCDYKGVFYNYYKLPIFRKLTKP